MEEDSARVRTLRFANYTLDLDSKTLFRDSQPVRITKTLLDALACLAIRAPNYISREELANAVWGERYSSSYNVSVLIGELRRMISPDAINSSRFGVRLNMEVTTSCKPSDSHQPTVGHSKELAAFLCHSSGDKPAVRCLYMRLIQDRFRPWLDEEDLLPGQDWEREISAAVRRSSVVLVCLSRASVTKEGFVQKEIKYALDVADEKPEGTIFIIPVRLEDCEVPVRLRRWHWVNLFEDAGYSRLLSALRSRQQSGGLGS